MGLDPSCGTGTTVVEAKKAGLPSFGCDAFKAKASMYCRTRCGGKERTKRYQPWTGRSSFWRALMAPVRDGAELFDVGCIQKAFFTFPIMMQQE
jgi:hypothetical protein